MQSGQQRKVVTVDRGFFLVRYVEADDPLAPPTVRLVASPASREDLRFLLHPDESEAVLQGPGTALVLRAEMAGRITMDIIPVHEAGSTAAKIRFEPLVQSITGTVPSSHPAQKLVRDAVLGITGHVASRGDVRADAGSWLAGPSAPARIEGFAIDWQNKPHGVDLRYTVKTAQSRGAYSPPAFAGSFVGSRGRALPILGLQIELCGPEAGQYCCSADVLFLGASVAQHRGRRIEGTGPTGREPLVGLRIAIIPTAESRQTTGVSATEGHRRHSPIEQVKIYRSDTVGQRLPV